MVITITVAFPGHKARLSSDFLRYDVRPIQPPACSRRQKQRRMQPFRLQRDWLQSDLTAIVAGANAALSWQRGKRYRTK